MIGLFAGQDALPQGRVSTRRIGLFNLSYGRTGICLERLRRFVKCLRL